MKHKILAVSFAILLLVCLSVPCFASSGMSSGSMATTEYVHALGWDSMWFDMYTTRQQFDHPYFSVLYDTEAGDPAPTYTYNLWSAGEAEEEVDFVIQGGLSPVSSTSATVGWMLDVYPYSPSNGFTFGFTGSTMIYDRFQVVYNSFQSQCTISVPAYTTLTYSFGFDLLVPLRTVENNGSVHWTWETVSLTSGATFVNSTNADVDYSYFPSISSLMDSSDLSADVIESLRNFRCFIVGSAWTGFFHSDSTQVLPRVQMTHMVTSASVNVDPSVALSTAVANHVTSILEVDELGNPDVTAWLGAILGGLWGSEFLPGITFGGLVSVVFGIAVLFAFLKLFGR